MNFTADYTNRIRLKYMVSGYQNNRIIRVKDPITASEISGVIDLMNTALFQLGRLSGLEPSDRRAKIDFLGAEFSSRGSNLFTPLDIASATIDAGYGNIQVRDLCNLITLTGRSVNSRVVLYFPGIAANLGVDLVGGMYGDWRLTPSEIPAIGLWCDTYFGPNGSIRPYLVGNDNNPIVYIQRRLLVRFSSKNINRMRK